MIRRIRNEGFTLVELLTVMFVVVALAVIAIPNVRKAILRAQLPGCTQNLRNIGTALAVYYAENRRYPTDLRDLVPKYINSMPKCPAAQMDTYTESYEHNTDPESYTIYCKGKNHFDYGMGENESWYSSATGLGP